MKELEVRLGVTHVGTLLNLDDDRNLFTFAAGYRALADRPTLGQNFLSLEGHVLDPTSPTRRCLAPFFANLLPEGYLRTYLAKRAGVNADRDFPLIRLLGADLPGAVIVSDPLGEPLPPHHGANDLPDAVQPLRFSLAGVQLKFSAVVSRDGGLAIPVEGMGGGWIVKLPSTAYVGVPENEFSMMTFARAIGIDVTEVGLVATQKIAGLPSDMRHDLGDAYRIKRFDRADDGGRIHVEDFAQIQGLYPEEKYERTSYAIIAGIVNELAAQDIEEYVRRLVFMIGIGNGDMHAKNWALIYPDGRNPRLAPAYDFVATRRYLRDDASALNLGGTKVWEEMNVARFERLADRARLSRSVVTKVVRETVQRMREIWPRVSVDLPADDTTKALVKQNLATLPLFTNA